ncbi:MAG: serine O-acetyltransferase [Tepidisphaerales bacterium]
MPGGLTLWQILREDLARHDGDWTLPGFRALAVQRFGVWHRGISSPVLRKVVGRVWLSLYRYVRNTYGIELPYTTVIGRRLRIEHQGSITVHGFARIGDDCILRQGVTIGNRSVHEPLLAPVLGDRVDVGAGAVLVGDIVVGDDARIGANAVVLADVPPGATAVGVPAKVICRKVD